MNILELIQSEHQNVHAWLELLQRPDNQNINSDLLFLKLELESHLQHEEKHFYALLKLVPGVSEWVRESISEHNELRRHLRELVSLERADPRWSAHLIALTELLTNHSRVEETIIFEKIRALGPEILDKVTKAAEDHNNHR